MIDLTDDKFLTRFPSLIDEGRNLAEGINGSTSEDGSIDEVKFAEWRTKVGTLLALVIANDHIHRAKTESIIELPRTREAVLDTVGFLRGVRDDFSKGFLADLSAQIEAEMASDYLGQAAELLDENHDGKFDHIPAAVLAGAVLEKTLRSLCQKQEPPISLKAKGKFKMMNGLVEDLRKAKILDRAQEAKIRVWMLLRNHAAHGEFNQLKRDDIKDMVSGIKRFIRENPK